MNTILNLISSTLKLQISIFFLISSSAIFAQTIFSFGPELGINSSGIPQFNSYDIQERGDYVKESHLPLISPIIGGFASLHAGKHFFISTGVNYKMVGTRDHSHRDGNNLGTGNTYTSDRYYYQTFHTISSSELLGYNFFICKKQFQVQAGYTFNYFMAGSHLEHTVFDEENGKYTETEKELNPFDPKDFALLTSRWNNQLTIALGFNVKEKLNFSITGSLGKEIYYPEYRPDYWHSWCATGWGKSYTPLDFAFTVKYNLSK